MATAAASHRLYAGSKEKGTIHLSLGPPFLFRRVTVEVTPLSSVTSWLCLLQHISLRLLTSPLALLVISAKEWTL